MESRGNVSGRNRTIAARQALGSTPGKSLLVSRSLLEKLVETAEGNIEKEDRLEHNVKRLRQQLATMSEEMHTIKHRAKYKESRQSKVIRDLERKVATERKRSQFYHKLHSNLVEANKRHEKVISSGADKNTSTH